MPARSKFLPVRPAGLECFAQAPRKFAGRPEEDGRVLGSVERRSVEGRGVLQRRCGYWLEQSILHPVEEAASDRAGSDAMLAKLSEALFVERCDGTSQASPRDGRTLRDTIQSMSPIWRDVRLYRQNREFEKGPIGFSRPPLGHPSAAKALVSCLRSSLVFSGRGIPPRGVARRLHIPDMRAPRALRSGRRVRKLCQRTSETRHEEFCGV